MSEENKSIVQRFINEFQTNGREEIALEILAENFVDHSAIPPFTPDRNGVFQLFRMLRSAFSEFRAEIQDQLADGDKVVTRKTLHGVHTGEFFGIAATKNPIKLGVIDILRLKERSICRALVSGRFRRLNAANYNELIERNIAAIPSKKSFRAF